MDRKQVELRLLYDYDSSLKTDAIHGKPFTASCFDDRNTPYSSWRNCDITD